MWLQYNFKRSLIYLIVLLVFFPYFICTDYNAKQRSALHGMRRDAIQYNTIQYNAMHYSTIHEKNVMQCDQCNS